MVATFLVSLLEDSFEGLSKREPCPKLYWYAWSGESYICRIYIYMYIYYRLPLGVRALWRNVRSATSSGKLKKVTMQSNSAVTSFGISSNLESQLNCRGMTPNSSSLVLSKFKIIFFCFYHFGNITPLITPLNFSSSNLSLTIVFKWTYDTRLFITGKYLNFVHIKITRFLRTK